jgi:hypothetical protein
MVRGDPFPPMPEAFGPHGTLVGVATHLAPRHSRNTDERDPDDNGVRWFLESGFRILQERLLGMHQTGAFSAYNDVFGSLTHQRVLGTCRRLLEEHGHALGAFNRSRFTNRWELISNYHADVLAYVFRTETAAARHEATRSELPNLAALPFGELVQILAVQQSRHMFQNDAIRLQMALQQALVGDPHLRQLAGALYSFDENFWVRVYEAIATCFGVRVTKWTWADLAKMFASVVEAAGSREAIGQSLAVVSSGDHLAVAMIQALLSDATQLPWPELAVKMAQASLSVPL